ncbi:DNA cytosine methyltransferase [Holdemanella porci]|uniref:DNA cytosine methyltransferase n=1 Tax=Holdemanella porci TaxID=2652276 RepID=UPI00294297EC|nr:DNA cytosine methyltransferase [Holdemanella porci]
MEKIQILELFGGIGSPRCALRNIGVDVKAIDYVEIDEKAVRSYNAMFENELPYKTQSVVGWNLRPDILIHGSPCQDFSIAGHQKGADEGSETRSSLMWETIHIIQQMGVWKPRYVIWENVKNVLSKHMIHNFNCYLKEMEKMGYTNSFEILNAREFGLPQNRNRVFTVSVLGNEYFEFDDLIRTKEKNINDFLEKTFEDKYIVGQKSMLKKIESKDSSFKVKVIKDYCDTITCKQVRSPNAGVIRLDDGRYRYLTERECWRLQGYTDEDFDNAARVNPGKEGCMNSALYKQAGNSIPVPIFESIFRKIILNQTDSSSKENRLF